MDSILITKEFNAPIEQIFELLSKHDTYNIAFAPMQVERIKNALDANRPDGVGSIRKLGLGKIKPLQEQITLLLPNKRIEYKLLKIHWSNIILELLHLKRLKNASPV